ncbi:MAG: hypothetical protein ACE5JS_01620 [Nitrospinota bacterium]
MSRPPVASDPPAEGKRTPPPLLLAIGAVALLLFLATGYQWAADLKRRKEAQEAIALVQERQATNLTENALNTDARSYDWIARRMAPSLYHVKQNMVLDRIWRFDRWENLCWEVRLHPEDVRQVGCGTIGWNRAPQIQGR